MLTDRLKRQRLEHLEELLEIEYEKLGNFQKELTITASAQEKFELRQRLKRELLPDIRKHESEYAGFLTEEPPPITEADASKYLVEVTSALTHIETLPVPDMPPQLVPLLSELRRKLEEPSKTATAKLKLTLPIIPLIASYEMELDTEAVMVRVWRQLKSLFRNRE